MKKYIRDKLNTTSSSSSSSTTTSTTITKKKKIVRNGRKRKATTDGAGLLALVDAANKKIKKKNKAKRNALFIKWTEEEDKLLAELVQKFKCKRWKEVAQHFPNRTATQCSQHWRKCADPLLKKNQKWTDQEDAILLKGRKEEPPLTFGEIANLIHGRTNIQCRNRWDNVVNPKIRKGPFSETEDEILFQLRKEGLRWVDMPEHRSLRNRSSVSLKNRYRRLKSLSLNNVKDSDGGKKKSKTGKIV